MKTIIYDGLTYHTKASIFSMKFTIQDSEAGFMWITFLE